jgi:predicted ester cyclase
MIEAQKEMVRSYYEDVVGAGRLELLDELFDPDYQEHETFPTGGNGLPAFKRWLAAIAAAFPDREVTLHAMVAEGDLVAARWSSRATHSGQLAHIPPTGRQLTITGTGFFRFADDKIVERWSEEDRWGMFEQLGLLPRGQQPAA